MLEENLQQFDANPKRQIDNCSLVIDGRKGRVVQEDKDCFTRYRFVAGVCQAQCPGVLQKLMPRKHTNIAAVMGEVVQTIIYLGGTSPFLLGH